MSDTTILTAALLTTGSTVAASVLPHTRNMSPAGCVCEKGDLPSFRMLLGQALVFTGLGMIAPGAPKLAGSFALVIAFTALTYYGLPILDEVFAGDGLCKPGTTPKNC